MREGGREREGGRGREGEGAGGREREGNINGKGRCNYHWKQVVVSTVARQT